MLNKEILHKAIEAMEEIQEEKRVPKNLVKVKFESGLTLSYFSDLPEIKEGDVVTVDGKMEDEIAVVVKVLSSFKKPKFDMKWIVSKIDNDLTGNYFKVEDDVVSFDLNLTVDKFMNIYAGVKYKENIAVGEDDVELDLNELEESELFEEEIKHRGRLLYKNNAVQFIWLKDGIGKAAVRSANGCDFYEIDFRYKNEKITYIACDCPYFEACKHTYALLLKLKDFKKKVLDKYQSDNFVMCRKGCFNYMMLYGKGRVSI